VQQLQEATDSLQAAVEAAMQPWRNLQDVAAEYSLAEAMHAAASSDGADDSSTLTSEDNDDEEAASMNTINSTGMWYSRADWVNDGRESRESYGRSLYQAMQRWADAVCATLPSRRCCSNPCCVVLCEMSESNLVNGKACCCGGCSAADQAVRYCSRDCQVSQWKQHKTLCRIRRKQQQQEQGR
jgi:hypothetical protein